MLFVDMDFSYIESKEIPIKQLFELYNSVGWSAYTKDTDTLAKAIQGSPYVCAVWDKNILIALVRCISDDASIMYLQDVLVRPKYQHKGIGRILVQKALYRYGHVRQKLLLTDDRPEQLNFYASLGYKNIKDYETLNTFMRLDEDKKNNL